MKGSYVFVILLVLIAVVCVIMKAKCRRTEGFSSGGLLTTTGLSFYNNGAGYSLPPSADGAFAGGNFEAGPVLF